MEQYIPSIQGNELKIGDMAVLYQKDYQRIYRYIVSMVGDTAEAEDLTQETFLRAYRSRNTLRKEGAQTAWLYQIATHACLDRLRQYARRGPMESDTDLDQVELAEPDSPSLQKSIERGEMSVCIQNYLNRLSDSYRAVILLHDMHDLTATEIARLLNESVDNVKIRLHRARHKLKIALEGGCDFSVDENSTLTCESRG